MKLHVKQHSDSGAPLVILHGLYGNQANWSTHARQLAEDYAVYAFDARNHGQSPHADSMLLQDMATDVAETMDSLGLASAHVLGHSMGGKTAMLLALHQPERVRSLIVVDIAPVAYTREDDAVLKALVTLDLTGLRSRSEADARLAEWIDGKATRDFLLTNLQRGDDGSFQWRVNVPAIERCFSQLTGWPDNDLVYDGPVLFIDGDRSDYILPEHRAAIDRHFPRAAMKTVADAGHWVHSEKPEALQRLVGNFLRDLSD
jgi:esterase